MTAKIIQLKDFRSNVVCPPLRLRFPTVYRMTGYSRKSYGSDEIDENTPLLEYALANTPLVHIVQLTSAAIERLDPAIDTGWLFVRHHDDAAALHGYLDGINDAEPHLLAGMVWQTDQGLFSVYNNRNAPAGYPDHLLIYIARVPVDNPFTTHDYWTHVVRPDGTVADDSILYPE